MEILAKIFNGPAKPKIMRIFIFNPTMTYDMADIAGRSQVSLSQARAEVSNLLKAGVIRKKNFVKEVHTNKGKKVALKKRWVNGFTVNEKFQYLKPLQDFLLNTNAIKPQDVMKKVKRVGRIKLLIVAGVFIRDLDSRVDILVVGDRLRRRSVEAVMSSIEAEIGKELKYATFETADFMYRISMYDKLVRDILDFPHQTIVDKLGVTS